MSLISIITPVFNEQEVLNKFYERVKFVMDKCGHEYEFIFVNDGSRDSTENILAELSNQDKRVKVINFSRNFGQSAAIIAGISESSGDAAVILDADLQDPPEVIPEMIAKWQDGFEVVHGKRIKRDKETVFKKVTAAVYYRLLRILSHADIPTDVGEFRLIDRKVCQTLSRLKEQNKYVRGLVSWVGFRQTSVEYNREGRFAGTTKFSLSSMICLARDGILSFTDFPLRLPGILSGILTATALISFVVTLIKGQTVNASVIELVLFLAGIILFSIRVLGMYLFKILEETRERPAYIVQSRLGFDNNENS